MHLNLCLVSQKELAILHDRVYQAHGATSAPCPKFPFVAAGVKESRVPEPVAEIQPPSGTSSSVGTQPQPTINPYGRGTISGLGGTTSLSGFVGSSNVVGVTSQPGQTGYGGSSGYVPTSLPFNPSQPNTSSGPAIMHPISGTYTTGQPSIMQPGTCVCMYTTIGDKLFYACVPSLVPRPSRLDTNIHTRLFFYHSKSGKVWSMW